ncbi:conjugal transfer protein TraX [Paenibacillus sp. IB182496]|uniref:Conjugal transfer protein TraX n=1 Tax=Paenibacillus sabuli TaxID=2772509 RepID=A0A927GSW4_9BACL|nr:TraX family protein [Paenibacillus sabuli]MBD2846092.1 conjugal transfer protein TraX [Paenibacillus sabuli]
MQIIAMLTMLIDHLGIVFFPGEQTWRIIGRISFPLYAFALVLGYYHTSNMRRYLLRLAVIALLAQIPYMLVLDASGINVVGALLLSLLVLLAFDRVRGSVAGVAAALTAAVLLEALNFDYGYYGLALVLIYRYSRSHLQVALHLALNLLAVWDKGWVIQMFSLATTLTLVYTPQLYRAADRLRPPRWVWRSFYPGHLALLAAWLMIAH